MPVPSSFLLDSQGRVSVIYRGPVSIDQLLSDVSQLSMSGLEWQTAAFPFDGKWNATPAAVDFLTIPRRLLDRNQTMDAMTFVKQNHAKLAQNDEYPKLLTWLGDQLMKRERSEDAIEQYQLALQLEPNDINAINNFAWQLATHPDANVRNGSLAVKWAEHAAKITHDTNPAILDTLAASYAEDQQFEKAVTTLNAAIKIATRTNQAATVKEFRSRLSLYLQKQAFRDR
jgi:tetratricopeptide (TPR) repeat protein